ncbi:hypothetical protein AAG570_002885 [Ranatra chinensis]|uniref:Uncharacterized protein n=1 Tax=Ranatra chinensis TaxID=642074 RepID=A0ABD0Y574_9HEMI
MAEGVCIQPRVDTPKFLLFKHSSPKTTTPSATNPNEDEESISSEEDNCRKKRCNDRYDSSESSDRGPQALLEGCGKPPGVLQVGYSRNVSEDIPALRYWDVEIFCLLQLECDIMFLKPLLESHGWVTREASPVGFQQCDIGTWKSPMSLN